MAAWSKSEMERSVEEVKRRSALDPAFRALALLDPLAALGKVNPRPLPVGAVRFVESADALPADALVETIVAVLPPAGSAVEELSDDDLEDVAGGGGTPPSPPPPPPVGFS